MISAWPRARGASCGCSMADRSSEARMLTNYLKLAFKVLMRRKFFTFVSLFGTSVTLLVLMIGAAMLDHVFAPLAPEVRLDRTLHVSYMAMRGDQNEWSGDPGYGFLDRYCRNI